MAGHCSLLLAGITRKIMPTGSVQLISVWLFSELSQAV